MSHEQSWEFDDHELPNWARSSQPEVEVPSFSWRTVPAPTPLTTTFPIRSFIWRVVLIVSLPVCIFCGASWHSRSVLLPAAGTAFVLGILLAFVAIVVIVADRISIARARALALDPVDSGASLLAPLVYFPIAATLFVFVSAAAYHLFAHPFTAVLLLAPLGLFLQARLGRDVFAFAREKLLISEWISREERERRSRDTIKPDLRPLAVCLAIVLLVPAFFSTTAGILVLVGGLAYFLTERFQAVLKHGPARLVFAGLLMRADRTVTEYCDYEPTEHFHWRPVRGRARRFWTLLAATWTLDLIFLVGLTGFFPWEFAAGLTVPGYDLPLSILTHYQTGRYQWILTPVELASKADPPGLYLAGLLIAALLFAIVTPAMLLATYMPGLIELENLAQHVKTREFPASD